MHKELAGKRQIDIDGGEYRESTAIMEVHGRPTAGEWIKGWRGLKNIRGGSNTLGYEGQLSQSRIL